MNFNLIVSPDSALKRATQKLENVTEDLAQSNDELKKVEATLKERITGIKSTIIK